MTLAVGQCRPADGNAEQSRQIAAAVTRRSLIVPSSPNFLPTQNAGRPGISTCRPQSITELLPATLIASWLAVGICHVDATPGETAAGLRRWARIGFHIVSY